MANGIGAYYSPSPLRPVNPMEAGAEPVRPVSGMGAYYSPSPFRPVSPSEKGAGPIHRVNGLGDDSAQKKAAVGLLFFLVLGLWVFRKGVSK